MAALAKSLKDLGESTIQEVVCGLNSENDAESEGAVENNSDPGDDEDWEDVEDLEVLEEDETYNNFILKIRICEDDIQNLSGGEIDEEDTILEKIRDALKLFNHKNELAANKLPEMINTFENVSSSKHVLILIYAQLLYAGNEEEILPDKEKGRRLLLNRTEQKIECRLGKLCTLLKEKLGGEEEASGEEKED